MNNREENDDQAEDAIGFENVFVVAVTAKALLCRIDGTEHWIPRSQITDDSELWNEDHKGTKGTLVITARLAFHKDLI